MPTQRPTPKVSVAMITYNHERYIEQAVRSVLMQKTDFNYEILIGDDCSTDSTRNILTYLAEESRGKIRLLLRKQNMGSGRNFVSVIEECQGDFVAILEGDDYWLAPNKLARQVEFLELNANYSMCFHWASFFDENTHNIAHGRYGPMSIKNYYEVDDLLIEGNFIPTASILFRNRMVAALPEWYVDMAIGDFPFNIFYALKGKIGFIDALMSVYRQHSNGAFSGKTQKEQIIEMINTYECLGSALGLNQRRSYWIGISNNYARLCWALRGEGDWWSPIRAASRAIALAPSTHKGIILYNLARHFCKRLKGKFISPNLVLSKST